MSTIRRQTLGRRRTPAAASFLDTERLTRSKAKGRAKHAMDQGYTTQSDAQ